VSCALLRAIKLTETVQNVNFQNLCSKNDKQLSSTIIQLSIYQIHHIYNPQMFFPTQMSFPSLPLTPWDLCWMCWIRWRDVGFVGSATRSRERFFEPPERRTAAMRIAMRPLDFSMDFFPPKKGRRERVLWEFEVTILKKTTKIHKKRETTPCIFTYRQPLVTW